MAQANAHALLSGMSPWGTLDDIELINLAHDEDEEITPIWHGVPGHEEFESTTQAVNALAKIGVDVIATDWSSEEAEEVSKQRFLGMFDGDVRTDLPALFAHAVSMALDDFVQVEAAQIRTGYHEYGQVMIRGAGIGNVLKAGLFAKNM